MELLPHEKIGNVPTGQGKFVDILSTFDFIDVADAFILKTVRGIRKSYYEGLTASMFEAQLKFGFHKNYKIESVEFRRPFNLTTHEALIFGGIDLFMPTLIEVQSTLSAINVATRPIDVGLEAYEIGVSFFSSDFENDLDVALDAVTVHF